MPLQSTHAADIRSNLIDSLMAKNNIQPAAGHIMNIEVMYMYSALYTPHMEDTHLARRFNLEELNVTGGDFIC